VPTWRVLVWAYLALDDNHDVSYRIVSCTYLNASICIETTYICLYAVSAKYVKHAYNFKNLKYNTYLICRYGVSLLGPIRISQPYTTVLSYSRSLHAYPLRLEDNTHLPSPTLKHRTPTLSSFKTLNSCPSLATAHTCPP
jgi:hypothetical protein